MIKAENLIRKYGNFTAVSDVSFEIGKGEIVGLLGHNGAGKTTIMKMLTGYLEPTAGTITINGMDVTEDRTSVQQIIGYLPENCPVYPEMTVIDYLQYTAGMHGIDEADIDEAVHQALIDTDLEAKAVEEIGTLSRGLRQRVGVAQAILHRPKILILDEPTNGLDPSQIQQMRELVKRLAKNATVILSTHIMQEVQAVCDRVIVIHQGEKALDTKLKDLQDADRLLVTLDAAPAKGVGLLKDVQSVEDVEHLSEDDFGHKYALKVNGLGLKGTAPLVAKAVTEQGFNLYTLQPEQRDLEAVFADINSMARAGEESEGDNSHV